MNRANATSRSSDATTLRLSVAPPAHGRTQAQLEHNAMQALALTRAILQALELCTRSLDRASLLLAHSPGLVENAVKPELKRVFAELATQVNTAQLNGEALLRGGDSSFALEDPWQETSRPLRIELPDLRERAQALAGCDLGPAVNALSLAQRNSALLAEIRLLQKTLLQTLQTLNQILGAQRRGRDLSAVTRNQDDGFVSMIGRVRDHVLTSGGAALRVQGAPTARAAWLVERREEAQ